METAAEDRYNNILLVVELITVTLSFSSCQIYYHILYLLYLYI